MTSASSAYDTTFTLTGTVSAGSSYPAIGDGVSVTINGVTENTTITGSAGQFTINYKNCNAPVGGGPYTITYNYNGPTLGACSDATTTLTVTGPGAVVLYGTRMYDGTATAAAAMLYVSNAAPGDVVTVGGGSVSLAGASVGSETITSFTGLTLGGAQAADYTLTGAIGTVAIVAPPFAVGQPDFEPFNYTPGNNLVGQINAQGLTWYAMGTNSTQPSIQSGTLTVPGLAPDSGNSVTFGGIANGTTARLDLGTNTTNSTFYGGSSYTLYYSMSFEVMSTAGLSPTTAAFVAAFNGSTGTSASPPSSGYARLYLRADGAGFDMGINKSDGVATNIAWEGGVTPTVYGAYTTYFVVGAYTFSGNPGVTNDSVSLWVNPSYSTFGAATAPTADVTTAAGNQSGTTSSSDEIASFYLRTSSAFEPQTMIADELSIGLSWADVTPLFPPFSITSETLDPNIAGNIILTWQSISGYSYQVIGSTSVAAPLSTWMSVGSPITASGTSTTLSVPTSSLTFFAVESQQ